MKLNADIEYWRPSVSYSTKIVQFCRQMSKNVSYVLQTIFISYGIRLQVNVVPQCRNNLVLKKKKRKKKKKVGICTKTVCHFDDGLCHK
jgi:hypothetical protein